ncbi:MAG TPA: hypothetical protein VEW48_02865 [Thermoanaerobaculia bacterium]|nr:hypothetical protein [Thermoanaerobaculia bacterium]
MASPLTLLLPVIPGTTLDTLSATLGKYTPELDAALQSIGTVHYARTLLLDASAPNLQPSGKETSSYVLAVITEYDGSFDAYINDFVSQVGSIFDALLQVVVGGAAVTPVANNVAAFQAFVTQNDASQHAPNTSLFQAYTATVQEILASLPSQS